MRCRMWKRPVSGDIVALARLLLSRPNATAEDLEKWAISSTPRSAFRYAL